MPPPASAPAPSPISTSTAHAGGAATVLAGTWAVTYTKAEFFAAGATQDEDNPTNWGHFTLKLGQGRWWLTGPPGMRSGTYVVSGDKITFYRNDHARPGSDTEVWGPVTWSVYRDTLTFKRGLPRNPGPTGLAVKPFHKVAT